MNKKILVTKSVELAISSYNLSLIEHRFINLCIGRIHKDEIITPNSKCKVYTERFAREYGINYKEALNQLKKIKESLGSKKVALWGEFPNYTPWVESIDFISNDEIYVNFNRKIILYISQVKPGFIRYEIDLISKMKSSHSIRLYEICKTRAYEKARWKLEIQVDELKLMLDVADKYKQYGSFKRMLDSCVSEINEHTDINVELKERKLGKQVVGFVFRMEKSLL